MLNVVKVEGDQISTLWREQAVPQKHFVICECEVFVTVHSVPVTSKNPIEF